VTVLAIGIGLLAASTWPAKLVPEGGAGRGAGLPARAGSDPYLRLCKANADCR
jgi:hypothetical protein